LNYYRAAFRFTWPRVLRQTRRIETPTLLIWGEEDRYLEIGMTENLEQWVPDLRVERLPNVSHWVQHEVPEKVNQLMIEFLQR
ncbi:MAG: alpha/beta hydrolase, partial [Abitibacteriaceae bacterium]|nr:alpha/beta hydrolase [Abditibacteriaceae bacterium]